MGDTRVAQARTRASPAATGSRRRDAAGVATVWGLAWVVVCALVTFVVLLVAGITSRQHQLDAAADLSALAGADAVQRGRDPCTAADDLAAVNDAALTECTAAGAEITVAVRAALRLPFGLTGRLESRARAGPFHDWRPP